MTADPATLPSTAGLGDLLLITNRAGIRHVPIVDKGELVGIVSDRDLKLVLPSLRHDESWQSTAWDQLEAMRLSELIGERLLTIEPEMSVKDAAAVMLHEKISALPVVAAGKVVGIITTEDILRVYIERRPAVDEG